GPLRQESEGLMAESTVTPVTEGPVDEPRAPSRSRWAVLGLVVALLIALPMFRFMGNYNYVLQLGIIILMWVAMTSSWNILGGYTGYISLGHNVFFGVGGYVAGLLLLELGWSPFVTAPLAGLFAMLLGLVAGLITYRTHGPSFIISTIALLLVVTLLMDNWSYLGGSSGL